jgi:glycerate 2-kinase
MGRDLKTEARQIFEAGLRAVDPKEAVKRFVTLDGSIFRIGEKELNLSEFDQVWVVGAGKGSAAMAGELPRNWQTWWPRWDEKT